MARSLIAAALLCSLAAAKPKVYNTKPPPKKSGVPTVWIVPHSHDDVGWLKTVDQYYYGAKNDIQRAQVQNIFNSVMKELAWNTDRKFIIVEQAFFQRWWAEADDKTAALTRSQVASGQIEFINGGWCMHDESSPSFADMIDQTSLGHRLLLEQFNVTPRTTWQIDPFGHSVFQGSMMSSPLAGYNAVYFARADFQEIPQRQANRTTEMLWAGSTSQGLSAATLAGILHNGYGAPGGLDMAEWSGDAPVLDDETLEDYNVQDVVGLFVNAAKDQLSKYPGEDVMFTMGSDFNYENANTWYTNLDKLIHYVNQDGRVRALYGTPSLYTDAKLATAGVELSVNTYDFFPYADGPNAQWTGYFVSRAAFKGYVRDTSSHFHAAKQVQLLTGGAPDMSPANPLYRLERALGVAQHHDGVSGTSKQAVVYDYARRLAWGRQDADAMLSAAFAKLTGYGAAGTWAGCDLTNATICPALEAGQPAAVLIYNQQAQARASLEVRLSVGTGPGGAATYAVYDAAAAPVTAQLVPLSAQDAHLRTAYYNYSGSPAAQVAWLAFQAKAVPAAGYAVYFIVPSAAAAGAPHTHASVLTAMRVGGPAAADQTISNGVITITISGATGRVSGYANAATGVSVPLAQDFGYYQSSQGVPGICKACDGQASGAYIFRPNNSNLFPISADPLAVTLVTGPVVNEARQVWGAWASQTVRLWAGAPSADFEYTIGGIDWQDGWGKEVIATYATGLASAATWRSDSNGRDSVKRVRDFRPSYAYNASYQPVSGNFVPMNAFAYLSDAASGVTLNVVNDRTQAVASLADGALQVMVHRRTQHDDSRGVGEPMNETGLDGLGLVVRGTHRVSVDTPAAAGAARRGAVADVALWRPLLQFAPLGAYSPAAWVAAFKPAYSGLAAPLPAQLHLLTAHSLGGGRAIVRLAHSYEAGEDAALSANATVDLATLFAGVPIAAALEVTLTANQPLAAAPRVTYPLAGGASVTLPVVPPAPAGAGLSVTLAPMQIRTFMVTTGTADAAA